MRSLPRGHCSSSSLTRSRRSLPGLKCGTYLPASATVSPVLGLRPWRGGRKCRREAAEAADLDATALGERVAHDLEDLLDRQFDVLGGQMLLLGGDELDEFGFRHARARSSSTRTAPRLRTSTMRRRRLRGGVQPPRAVTGQSSSWPPMCSLSRSPRLVPVEDSPVR